MKYFKCSYQSCTLTYTTKYNLDRHINVSHKNLRFLCITCGEKLCSAQSLKDHSYCHTGEKPYLCKFPGCSKKYRQASQLSVHKKQHQKIDKKKKKLPKAFWLNILMKADIKMTYEIPSSPFKLEDATLPPLIPIIN
ncbi:unnamed protein product [Blepharisma stoltei]|uniref:C2H2-type domain-containing protein n=1 Tax=Blepharisma stoltei TaxID=1481888 RepID=A0AAU9KCM6_9CILI|nr:unnamed protein product [Blepharisma stoltei]